jgi:hypothetical protein
MKNLLLALLLLPWVHLWGVVTPENNPVGVQASGSVTSISSPSIVVGNGANRLLLCGVIYFATTNPSATVSTVTFNGAALSKLDDQRISVLSGTAAVDIWFKKAPATSSAPVVTTWNLSVNEAAAICFALDGVNQTSTFGTVSKASDTVGDALEPAVTVLSQSGALAVDFLWYDMQTAAGCMARNPDGYTGSPAGGCLGYPRAAWSGGRSGFASQEKPGTTNTLLQWEQVTNDPSNRRWNIIGVSIQP